MTNEKDDFKTLLIADSTCRAGCKSVWGLGNQLFVFAGKQRPESDVTSGVPFEGPFIHEVKWNTEMHSPITRNIVNETHDIFIKLQNYVKENAANIDKSQMVKFSREYRCVIKACLLDLQKAIKTSRVESESSEYEAQLQLFDMVELIWSLSEILFIDTQPGGLILSQLLDWQRWHFVEGDRHAREVMRDERPQDHTYYWDTIYGFVLQGRIDEARQMLAVHSSYQVDTFQSIDELLRKMPVYMGLKGQSVAEFDMRWRHWRQECVRRYEDQELAADNQLETILQILCGEEQVFANLKDICESWYCMLVSRLLYQKPSIKAFDLQHHTQFCINVYGGNSQLQPWDHILLAAIEFDVHQVVKESSVTSGNWWFVAHLTDLLHHCGVLESQTLYFGSNLREFLLLEYATSLMSHHSLWQVGATYLDQCPQFGRPYLENYVERLPLDSEFKAHKVLRMCEQRDMHEQAKSICKIMGMRSLHNQRLGSALSWALRSKDVAFVTNLAERFLTEYSESGDFSSLDLIDNLGSSMLLSSKLTFLGKYREFHKLYGDGEFKAAGSLLLSLLTARLAPKRLWLTLLTDALPLLEAEDVIFSSQQTDELLHCLEELSIAQLLGAKGDVKKRRDSNKSQAQEETEAHKVELMKLALARNLARSILHEGSVTA